MGYILMTIIAYLAFNVSIWFSINEGGMVAMAFTNFVGAFGTAIFFRKDIKTGSSANKMVALMGSLGILLIVVGLLGSHRHLPVSLSIEAVYNGFAIASWPLFVLFGIYWPAKFTERPNNFDFICHFAMAVMVFGRFLTYPGNFRITIIGISWIAVAITGYALFNISIKISAGNRATNILMNVGGGVFLLILSLFFQDVDSIINNLEIRGILLGGFAILMLVWALGKSYQKFGARNQSSLVAPLVYDGLLVAAPVLSIITGDPISLTNGILLGFGMLSITYIRWRYRSKSE